MQWHVAGKPDTTVSTSEPSWFRWTFGAVSFAQFFTYGDVSIGTSEVSVSRYLIQLSHLACAVKAFGMPGGLNSLLIAMQHLLQAF